MANRKEVELIGGQPPHAAEIVKLPFQAGRAIIKPIPAHGRAMNTEWTTNRVTQLARLEFVLTGEDFNAVGLPKGALNRHSKPQGEVVDVDPAGLGWKRFLAQNPEVSATA